MPAGRRWSGGPRGRGGGGRGGGGGRPRAFPPPPARARPGSGATPSPGAGVLGYGATHFRMPTLRPLQEYRPAAWPTDGPFFFLAALFVAAAAARRRWRQVLPAAALAALGALRIRFVAEFALLAAP